MTSHTTLTPITTPSNYEENPSHGHNNHHHHHQHPWPSPHHRAAYTFTLDNMGEAADLNRSLWPSSEPIGQHYSVTRVLPRLLDLLDKYNIKATYFIESWNLDVYPEMIREIESRGHEIAWHAWQHEAWGKMAGDAQAERENFSRSFQAFSNFNAGHHHQQQQPPLQETSETAKNKENRKYKGFRPPGGQINAGVTLPLSREFGLRYISPAAEHAAVLADHDRSAEALTVLPFRWRNIDAYYYMSSFSGLRAIKAEPDPDVPKPASELVRRYKESIDELLADGGRRGGGGENGTGGEEWLCTLFHPFLTDSDERFDAVEEVLRYVAEKRDSGGLWVARCDEVCEWVETRKGGAGMWRNRDPEWDLSIWR